MARPVCRPDSKHPSARKVVPVEVRHILRRTEFKRAIRADTRAEFCKLHGEAMAEFEAQIAAARAELRGDLRRLTLREADELAEDWYQGRVDALGGDAGTADRWELERDLLSSMFIPEVDPEGEPLKDQRRTFEPDTGTLRDARTRLLKLGIAADETSVRVFAERWALARWRLVERMERRLAGDWSDDEQGAAPRASAPQAASGLVRVAEIPKAQPMSWGDLLDRWAADKQPKPNTVKAYRATFRQLERVLGITDPRKVDGNAVLKFKEARRAEGIKEKTLHVDITAVGAVFQWGVKFKLLAGNPFIGAMDKPKGPAAPPVRPFEPDEAQRILRATRQETGWRRWLPWLLCFTGARISDLATLRRHDVQETGGVWELRLAAPDWREGKTEDAPRRLPVHQAVIAEGFLDYLAQVPPDGLLFPELGTGGRTPRTPDRIATFAQNAHAKWVRSKVGVAYDDAAASQTAPAHSWRHLLKDALERGRVPPGHQNAIMGHTDRSNAGAGYGKGLRNMPDELAPELNKVPSPIPPLGQPSEPTA